MGTIRKHEVRIIVAASLVLSAVLAVSIIYGTPEATSSSIPRTHDALPMEGIDVTVTGPAVRTLAGYEVPVNVTNHGEEAISIKEMRVIVTLADLSTLNATCHGPDPVAPGATESFLVMIGEPGEIEIFVIDLLQGSHYLRAVMPVTSPGLALPDVPHVEVPEDESGTTDPQDPARAGPELSVTLDRFLPLRPAYFEDDPPFFGEPVSGRVIAHVTKPGEAANVAVYMRFPDLSPGQVSVHASYGGGEAVSIQLNADGSGCSGLLIDDPARDGSGWTWTYDGSSTYRYISVTVTTYALGTHKLQLYANDAGTGALISEVEATSYTVYGSAGLSSMFKTVMSSDLADPFVPGAMYDMVFTDSCRYDQYHGTARSVFKCPYAASVWLVAADGNEILLTPNHLGEYTFIWVNDGSAHQVHLRVQMSADLGSFPPETGQYWIEDQATGMALSPAGAGGTLGAAFAVRGPQV